MKKETTIDRLIRMRGEIAKMRLKDLLREAAERRAGYPRQPTVR